MHPETGCIFFNFLGLSSCASLISVWRDSALDFSKALLRAASSNSVLCAVIFFIYMLKSSALPEIVLAQMRMQLMCDACPSAEAFTTMLAVFPEESTVFASVL